VLQCAHAVLPIPHPDGEGRRHEYGIAVDPADETAPRATGKTRRLRGVYGGRTYYFQFGSDTVNDGVFLEANDVTNGVGETEETVLCAFWCDGDDSFTFHCFRQELPFALVEDFVREARRCVAFGRPLPPDHPGR